MHQTAVFGAVFIDDGEEHPIGYSSRKLLPSEEHYSTVEKKCLAIWLAVAAFQVYLLGHKFANHYLRLSGWSVSRKRFQGSTGGVWHCSHTSILSSIEQVLQT